MSSTESMNTTERQRLSAEFDPAVLAGIDAPLDQFASVDSGVGETRGRFSTWKKKVLVGGAAMLTSLGFTGIEDVEADVVCVIDPTTGQIVPGSCDDIPLPSDTKPNQILDGDEDSFTLTFNPNNNTTTPDNIFGLWEIDDASTGIGQAGFDQLLADMVARGLDINSYAPEWQAVIKSVGFSVAPKDFSKYLADIYATPLTTTTTLSVTTGENASTTNSTVTETSGSGTTQSEMSGEDNESKNSSNNTLLILLGGIGIAGGGAAVALLARRKNNDKSGSSKGYSTSGKGSSSQPRRVPPVGPALPKNK